MSGEEAKYELTLSFDELTLIYKSLLAAKSLGVLSQDHGSSTTRFSSSNWPFNAS